MPLNYIKAMFKFRHKKNQNSQTEKDRMAWEPQATTALEQSLKQSPVPAALKGTVKKKLMKAAEEQARKSGHNSVSAQDLMQGLLAQMPANMRAKVEQAAKQGPEGLKNLEDDLRNH
jgi:hypothetical protein